MQWNTFGKERAKNFKFCTLYENAGRCIIKYHYKKNRVTIMKDTVGRIFF